MTGTPTFISRLDDELVEYISSHAIFGLKYKDKHTALMDKQFKLVGTPADARVKADVHNGVLTVTSAPAKGILTSLVSMAFESGNFVGVRNNDLVRYGGGYDEQTIKEGLSYSPECGFYLRKTIGPNGAVVFPGWKPIPGQRTNLEVALAYNEFPKPMSEVLHYAKALAKDFPDSVVNLDVAQFTHERCSLIWEVDLKYTSSMMVALSFDQGNFNVNYQRRNLREVKELLNGRFLESVRMRARFYEE
jgi:hypothetical protein